MASRSWTRTGAAATILIVLGAYFLDDGYLAHVVLLCVVTSLVLFVFRSPQRVSALVDGSTTIMGFLYCGWLPAHLILLRKLESLPAGTEIYAQVDAVASVNTYGAVQESDEMGDGPSNNIAGPVTLSEEMVAPYGALAAGDVDIDERPEMQR